MSNLNLDQSLFEVSALERLPVNDVRSAIHKHTFACIRGLISESQVRASVEHIRAAFDVGKDDPPRGQPPEAVRANFQKMNVGGESRTAPNDYARFFRAFYTPFWEDDIWRLHDALRDLARVRNRLAGLSDNFALEGIESNGLWTAARFHQYPAGGGFLRRHADFDVRDIAEERSTRFFQAVLTMSRKGEHYSEGGAFVDIDNERICLDDGSVPGDILIYDGRTVHGVEDIDPFEPLVLDKITGRLSGFATLYEKR